MLFIFRPSKKQERMQDKKGVNKKEVFLKLNVKTKPKL